MEMLLLSSSGLCSSCSVYLFFWLTGSYLTLYSSLKVADLIRLSALNTLAYYLDSGIVILEVLTARQQQKAEGGLCMCTYICQ